MRVNRLLHTPATMILALMPIVAPAERAFAQDSQTAASATPAQPASAAPAITPTQAATAVGAAQNWADGYTTPDAPALTLINANGSKIQEPGSVQKFGAALLSGITPQGGLQSGLAIEVTGRGLFGFGNNWVKYKQSFWEKFLARASLSVGTAQDSATATTTRAAVGLRLVFLDGTDPLVDQAYTDRVLSLYNTCPPDEALTKSPEEYQKCVRNALQALNAKLPAPKWNASGAALAVATSAAFTNGSLSQGSWGDTAVWLTGSLGLGSYFQGSAAAEYRRAEVSTATNVVAGALRLRGGGNWIRGSLEGDYASSNPSDPDNRKGKLIVGLDVKLITGTWFNVSMGGDYNFTGSPFGIFSLASLKYAMAQQPAN